MSVSTATATLTTDQAEYVAAYQAADRKGKAGMRKAVEASMNDAVRNLDIEQAVYFRTVLDNLVTSTEKTVRDIRPIQAQRLCDLRATLDAYVDTLDDEVLEMADNLTGVVSEKIMKLITVTPAGDRAPSNNLQSALDAMADEVESGVFYTVAQVQKATGLPSSGAIAARLFPTDKNGAPTACTLEGVEAVPAGSTLEDGTVTQVKGLMFV